MDRGPAGTLRAMHLRAVVLTCAALIATFLAAVPSGSGSATERATESDPGSRSAPGTPQLQVDVLARGLDHPWEVQELPSGQLLVTERERRTLSLVDPATGSRRVIDFPGHRVWAEGETGLLGLAVDPQFRDNRRIYTCSGWHRNNGSRDIRVIAWTLDRDLTRARFATKLRGGLPTSRVGKHAGCRLLILRSGELVVGTGDAARGRTPQRLRSLGGKVLRLDRFTGRPSPGNPWADGKGKRRYVLSYGHRNVQGLAQRADGTLWEVEHGTFRDDEINRIRKRGNYGWNPVPGYNETRPMTDERLPGRQRAAKWRSGNPTIAPSGADFVTGPRWGRLSDTLAVAVLKGERLLFVKFTRKGRLRWTTAPAELRRYGRLRDVTATRQGDLLVTTDNGDGRDVVLRVRPRT